MTNLQSNNIISETKFVVYGLVSICLIFRLTIIFPSFQNILASINSGVIPSDHKQVKLYLSWLLLADLMFQTFWISRVPTPSPALLLFHLMPFYSVFFLLLGTMLLSPFLFTQLFGLLCLVYIYGPRLFSPETCSFINYVLVKQFLPHTKWLPLCHHFISSP